MANTNVPGGKCYGYVTMASKDVAQRCMEKLNKTELHGRSITVEKASEVSLPGGFRQSLMVCMLISLIDMRFG